MVFLCLTVTVVAGHGLTNSWPDEDSDSAAVHLSDAGSALSDAHVAGKCLFLVYVELIHSDLLIKPNSLVLCLRRFFFLSPCWRRQRACPDEGRGGRRAAKGTIWKSEAR